jgi:hypothetical protein
LLAHCDLWDRHRIHDGGIAEPHRQRHGCRGPGLH